MNKRKESRDIMADLLADKTVPEPPKVDETPKTEPKPIIPTRPKAKREDPKIKMTLSLPSDIADRLTRFETDLRLHTGERGHALAKSAIIATSLQLLLDEYDELELECRLARHMNPTRRGRF